jgi:hypothetical protein
VKEGGKWVKHDGEWVTKPYGHVDKHVQTYAYGFTGERPPHASHRLRLLSRGRPQSNR